MKVWVCRAGKNGVYFPDFYKRNIISLAWEGYDKSFSECSKEEIVKLVSKHNHVQENSVSVRNWWGQIDIFVNRMTIGDYVVVPDVMNKRYIVGMIESDYFYAVGETEVFKHQREVRWYSNILQKELIPQDIIYVFGTYRTIYEVKRDKHIDFIISWVEG